MDWHSFVAPGCLLAGFAIKSVLEKLTRQTAQPEIKSAIKLALAEFKNDLMTSLNGTYVRSNGSKLTGSEIEYRLKHLEKKAGA